ncbi:MAG: 2-hydroxyacyl-CoA dehydratase, partial [Bryobacteraceae bacterium]
RQMVRDFGAPENDLCQAIAEGNRARAAVREILHQRHAGRLEGSAAITIIRGFYTEDREQFARSAPEKLRCISPANSESRPRIMIKGAPLDHTALHCLVERCGGYVVAEDDWSGSRAAGDHDIRMDGDPVVAIFDKYFYDAVSPRVHPPSDADAWFGREIKKNKVNGVLFYIPLEDDVVGWDYPRHLALLKTGGVPSLAVRESGAPEPSSRLTDQVSDFVRMLRRE